ncbi:hypothetical protein Trydic_g6694 [Trypoxylus dichotomus]
MAVVNVFIATTLSLSYLIDAVQLLIYIGEGHNILQPTYPYPRTDNVCEFPCDSGECLDFKHVCDGLASCKDGSDETEKACGGSFCPVFLSKCNYGACIEKHKVCNGEKDCADNSDEDPSVCVRDPSACLRYEHRCEDGECISDDKMCDGKMDCKDDSDETEKLCGNVTCPDYLLKCAYGACVPLSARCDGELDCVDGSDERDCYYSEEVYKRLKGKRYDCLLPDHPVNGFYEASGVDGWIIKHDGRLNMTCNLHYSVWGSQLFRCENGSWTPPLNESYCRRTCRPLLTHPTYDIVCVVDGHPTTCKKPFEGAIANVTCKDSYAPYGGSPSIVCQSDGNWSDVLIRCIQMQFGSGCLLPPHLPNGTYELVPQREYRENAYVPLWSVLRISCNPGFTHATSNFYSICDKGHWSKLNESTCLRVCRSLYPTDSYNVRCEYKGQTVSCENPLEDTTVQLICAPYYKFYYVFPILSCQNGEWDPSPTSCQPECGLKIANAQTLIIRGEHTVPGEYPWVVAIYKRRNDELRQVCSGTLISRFYVLSAAHCFANDAGDVSDPSVFTLVAGKYYRDFNANDSNAQIRQIRRLFVHEDYKGAGHAYRDDIALIQVESFILSETVQIVCIDWENIHESNDFQDGKLGVVVGWGLTKEASTPAETLQKLEVPYRSMKTCGDHIDKPFFKRFFVSDKICAGYSNQSMSVCKGDSGGGLFFQRKSDSIFFVRGIVSISPTSTAGCNSNHYSLYTKVSKYLQWIEDKTRRKL